MPPWSSKLRTRAGALATLLGAAGLLTACGGSAAVAGGPTGTTPPRAVARCPLTGTPAPNGVVPRRPALAIKVDNYSYGPLPISPPDARPQSGLDDADVVFEEQVEGAITRYAAVFQCHAAPLVGDVRSARQLDIGILSELDSPLLVHVGGIVPVLNNIERSTLVNVDLGTHPDAEVHPPGRFPPYDDFTTTDKIWSLFPDRTTPPSPIFTYSAAPVGGRPATQVHLDWSFYSDIYWRWDPATGTWLRFYDTSLTPVPDVQPDMLADGVQDQAQNVVVQLVHLSYGPWAENFEGGLEVEAQLANNSGRAYVFRNGRMIAGTWSKGPITSPTVFTDAQHRVIPLAPGRTWVELLSDTVPVQVTFPTTTPGTTAEP
jgi:Protein of unknown function (DUF3048) N-terminal domain/Protein of unknown function (DUF3048) C-terminal domain